LDVLSTFVSVDARSRFSGFALCDPDDSCGLILHRCGGKSSDAYFSQILGIGHGILVRHVRDPDDQRK
jgi:hypothetical protein